LPVLSPASNEAGSVDPPLFEVGPQIADIPRQAMNMQAAGPVPYRHVRHDDGLAGHNEAGGI
jgi:hypothetical protein